MAGSVWVVATEPAGVAARAAAVRPLGDVTVLAIGPRPVAEAAAAAGPSRVLWCEPAAGVPVEAYAGAVAALVAEGTPRLVAGDAPPAARALLGAIAVAVGAAALPGALAVRADGDGVVVERSAVGGAVVETLATHRSLVVILEVADDAEPDAEVADAASPAAPPAITPVSLDSAPGAAVTRRPSATSSTGLADAPRVVAVGRGLRARADMALVTELAETLGAEVACSMPVADDLGWVEKSRYVGRSGQTISPRLYLTVGISGAPQHLEGIRGAKVVAAIDSDPAAPIFRRATYGVVGDLYEVVPALVRALQA
jgi:electron transfer flavoprotein alpha subunit